MEDAHIALLKVPHGQPPTSAAIGAARIGLFSSQSQKSLLGHSGSNRGSNRSLDVSNGSDTGTAARVRAGTFSAGDTGSLSPPQGSPRKERQKAQTPGRSAGPRRASTGTSLAEDSGKGDGSGGGSSSGGAGWKAVDLLEDAALFGVFDGHGGKAVADFCKERLPGEMEPKSNSEDDAGGEGLWSLRSVTGEIMLQTCCKRVRI